MKYLQTKKSSQPCLQTGFTLIEVMLALTIAGILAMFAVPEMNFALQNAQVRTVSSDIHTTLLLSRSEAIKRNSDINIVPVSFAWTNGWEVKSGTTILPNGKYEATSGVTILCFTNPAATFPCGSGGVDLTFERTGRSLTYIEFRVFNSTNTNIPMRCIKVSLSGRPGSSLDTDSNFADGCD